jgi:hypothetical protein
LEKIWTNWQNVVDARDRLKAAQGERKRKQSSVFIDHYWGKEPSASLEPQYPRTEDKGMGANAWGSSDSSEEPKPKSNQE